MTTSRFRPGASSARIGCWALVTSLNAAGCAPVPNPHTVADYQANARLRARTLAHCANDPGQLGRTADCVNARQAEQLVGIGSLRALAPLNVPPVPASRE